MVVKVRSLTESIEKKYLSESSLTERYSDSMPSWLQDRLNFTQYKHRYENTKDVLYPVLKQDIEDYAQKDEITGDKRYSPGSLIRKRSSDYQARVRTFADKKNQQYPQYQHGRNDDGQLDLYYNFRKAGIPLDRVKIIEGPIPTKSTDPRLKEPNIPIFLLDQGQVYAKGMNDNEIDPDTGKGFKYTSMKNILSKAKAFAYIDGEDSSNFNAVNVRAERQNKASDWRKYERHRARNVDSEGQITKGFDKSGYPVPIDKWEKSNSVYLSQLTKKQLEIYREKLADLIDSYNTFQANLFNMLKDGDIKTEGAWYLNSDMDIGDISSSLQNKIRAYVFSARKYYTDALKAAAEGDSEKLIENTSGMSESIAEAYERMESTGLMPKKLATIDWI